MDVSGGFPAVIMRTLAYSEPGLVKLLPALPKEWKTGSIEGMALRGQITIDRLSWTEKGLEVTLTSGKDQDVMIELPGEVSSMETEANTSSIKSKKLREGMMEVRLKERAPITIRVTY
jgi:hypothetical protein